MKQLIKNYTFDKTAKTVTFTDFSTIALERVQLITDVTANVIIYQFNDSLLGGTAATNVLTLTYNTVALNNTDKLQIIYDSATGDPLYDATSTQGNVASGATDSGNPVKVGGKYNTTPPTLTNGQRGDAQLDVNGNSKVTQATLVAGEDLTNNVLKVEQRFSYSRATADVQIKAGSGFLHTVTFSATGTVTAGLITIYDNTAESGTVIWSGTIQTGLNPTTIQLDVSFAAGLYVGYDGTIANVATTVSYR